MLDTKNVEEKARAAKKQAQVPETTNVEASRPKQNVPIEPEAHDDMDRHSQHNFPNPRDAELWDSLGITEALWKKGEAEEAEIGEVYIPLTVEEIVVNFMIKLKELSTRDRTKKAKMHKFQKRVEAEEDEDIKAEVLSLLRKVTDTNLVTKSDVLVFKG